MESLRGGFRGLGFRVKTTPGNEQRRKTLRCLELGAGLGAVLRCL